MYHLIQCRPTCIDTDESLIPGVEGNRYPIACQNGGIASFGQETPDMNNKITDVKTNTSIGASRVVINRTMSWQRRSKQTDTAG